MTWLSRFYMRVFFLGKGIVAFGERVMAWAIERLENLRIREDGE